MRPGNYWSYLLLCAIAFGVAHAELLPVGQQVAAVFQQVIDGFQGKLVSEDVASVRYPGLVLPGR